MKTESRNYQGYPDQQGRESEFRFRDNDDSYGRFDEERSDADRNSRAAYGHENDFDYNNGYFENPESAESDRHGNISGFNFGDRTVYERGYEEAYPLGSIEERYDDFQEPGNKKV